MFWGVAEGRNPTAATLLRNIILVSIPPPSFGRPLWRVQTWVAPPRDSQVALFTQPRGREILRSRSHQRRGFLPRRRPWRGAPSRTRMRYRPTNPKAPWKGRLASGNGTNASTAPTNKNHEAPRG